MKIKNWNVLTTKEKLYYANNFNHDLGIIAFVNIMIFYIGAISVIYFGIPALFLVSNDVDSLNVFFKYIMTQSYNVFAYVFIITIILHTIYVWYNIIKIHKWKKQINLKARVKNNG